MTPPESRPSWLTWLTGRRDRHPAAAPARERLNLQIGTAPLYAIGDVHGRHDLLKRLWTLILADAAALGDQPWIVAVGDVIDRGPASADVIDFILAQRARSDRVFCLCGNHEAMMLDFLTAPRLDHPWLGHGGEETLLSYDVPPEGPKQGLRARIERAIPVEHIEFLKGLPIAIQTEAAFISHAGASPERPLAEQRDEDLLWFQDGMASSLDQADRLVVHGHQAVISPGRHGNRLNVDSGAYATGRLTAARLIGAEVNLLSVDSLSLTKQISPKHNTRKMDS